jgi:transcriptional regulator with XRE-family HTH domain
VRLKARLANGLRRERNRRGWTQEKAAEMAGLNVRHLQKLEEGSVNVTLRTLERLTRAYDVDITQLFGV